MNFTTILLIGVAIVQAVTFSWAAWLLIVHPDAFKKIWHK